MNETDQLRYVGVSSVTSLHDLRNDTGKSTRKSAVSGYTLFVKQMHAELMKKSPELSFSERSSMISTLWLVSSKTERDSYILAAQKMYNEMA